jgi:hypothetical protein
MESRLRASSLPYTAQKFDVRSDNRYGILYKKSSLTNVQSQSTTPQDCTNTFSNVNLWSILTGGSRDFWSVVIEKRP